MRKTIAPQLSFVPPLVDHPHARELARISEILDKLPAAAELVAKDLVKGTKATKAGRAGMSGEQVLRAGMLKQMHCWSYEDLAFHLSDSPTLRTFCRVGMMQSAPKRSALAENIKRVKPETFERVNQLVIGRAKREGVENGKRVRVDSTVIDSNRAWCRSSTTGQRPCTRPLPIGLPTMRLMSLRTRWVEPGMSTATVAKENDKCCGGIR